MSINISDIRLNKLKITFKSAPLNDITNKISSEMERIRPQIKRGMKIAISVGSRGIANISVIVKEVADLFKAYGAEPFIVPAMGSHGGATAEGQTALLEEYGITAETMGIPIISSMRVKSLGSLPDNRNVSLCMDENAFNSDGVFIINRVKAHTDFHGPNESGIAKMLVIGLGKHKQALSIHEHMVGGLKEYIPKAAQAIVNTGKIIGALAIVEDGYDETSVIEAVLPEEIVKADSELLLLSKSMMPSIPFERFDILLVDWMGKNISGTGMDTNIIGRINIRGEVDQAPYITRICLFDITPECHGNALGIGLADIIPRKLYEKIDWHATYENVLTSRFVERGFTPIIQPADYDAVNTAIKTCGYRTLDTLKLVRIKDTLHIDEIYVTDSLLNEIKDSNNVIIVERNIPLQFNERGEIIRL
jgi:hypothetical protein